MTVVVTQKSGVGGLSDVTRYLQAHPDVAYSTANDGHGNLIFRINEPR